MPNKFRHRMWRQRKKNLKPVPFGPAVAMGTKRGRKYMAAIQKILESH